MTSATSQIASTNATQELAALLLAQESLIQNGASSTATSSSTTSVATQGTLLSTQSPTLQSLANGNSGSSYLSILAAYMQIIVIASVMLSANKQTISQIMSHMAQVNSQSSQQVTQQTTQLLQQLTEAIINVNTAQAAYNVNKNQATLGALNTANTTFSTVVFEIANLQLSSQPQGQVSNDSQNMSSSSNLGQDLSKLAILLGKALVSASHSSPVTSSVHASEEKGVKEAVAIRQVLDR